MVVIHKIIIIIIYLCSIPEIHQSGYRTCHCIKTGIVQNSLDNKIHINNDL
jgi:hypothetical protein